MPVDDTIDIVKAECENSHVGIRNGGGRTVCFITYLALSLIEQWSRLLAALASNGRDAVVIQFSICDILIRRAVLAMTWRQAPRAQWMEELSTLLDSKLVKFAIKLDMKTFTAKIDVVNRHFPLEVRRKRSYLFEVRNEVERVSPTTARGCHDITDSLSDLKRKYEGGATAASTSRPLRSRDDMAPTT
ncbi:hypothetical protein J6590_076915 [Homalodisca vitripennis]|nr:hypothetical protein J6590_076915 [Homalodisca vitripennis]